MCASNCIGKQEAFARDDKRANGIFSGIVRYGPVAVLDVSDQLGPLPMQIGQGLTEQTLRHDAGQLFKHQRFDGIEHACTVSSSQSLSSFSRPRFTARLRRE